MVERYKSMQLGVVGWSAVRKARRFFGHVTEQASGWSETQSAKQTENTHSHYKFNSNLRSKYKG